MRNEKIVQRLNELKLHFDNGRYWNHDPNLPNDYLSVTDNPCTHHGTGNTGHGDLSGNCGCNSFPNGVEGCDYKSIQCHGFALCLAYLIFGNFPNVNRYGNRFAMQGSNQSIVDGANAWTYYSDLDDVQLEPGDVILNNGHTAIVSNTYSSDPNTRIEVAEVWGSKDCKIHWGNFNGSTNNTYWINLKENLTRVCKAPTKVNVHFETFGGEMPSDQSSDVRMSMDSTFSNLPTPTREGYTFKGWYRDPVSELRKVENGDDVDSIRDMTLYAHWQKKCYLTQDNKYLYVPGPLELLYNGKELKTISNMAIERAQWFVENMGSDYILRSVVNPAMAVGQMCYGECKACKILYPEPDLDACRVMLMEWDDNCTYCTIRLAEENLFLTRHSGGDLCWEERSPGRSQIWKLTDVVDS